MGLSRTRRVLKSSCRLPPRTCCSAHVWHATHWNACRIVCHVNWTRRVAVRRTRTRREWRRECRHGRQCVGSHMALARSTRWSVALLRCAACWVYDIACELKSCGNTSRTWSTLHVFDIVVRDQGRHVERAASAILHRPRVRGDDVPCAATLPCNHTKLAKGTTKKGSVPKTAPRMCHMPDCPKGGMVPDIEWLSPLAAPKLPTH